MLLEPLFMFLLIVVGYAVGFFPVMLGSLGSVEPGPIDRTEDHAYYRARAEKWWHVTYVDEGRRYLPVEGVALVGWCVIGLSLIHI